jgi:hypothetical protein
MEEVKENILPHPICKWTSMSSTSKIVVHVSYFPILGNEDEIQDSANWELVKYHHIQNLIGPFGKHCVMCIFKNSNSISHY